MGSNFWSYDSNISVRTRKKQDERNVTRRTRQQSLKMEADHPSMSNAILKALNSNAGGLEQEEAAVRVPQQHSQPVLGLVHR
jgi:hypothetical protein